eukprot:TRINITY_DN11772_c0_g1_i1.p1 TRINITY_DN11772_c0_g1~~TRINITY_DN11772_c0_g1_i1.p1  ORF type:complete len:357 (+),score=106.98 TRINITY_DN11772_c0_g1_i1:180-1250(+)
MCIRDRYQRRVREARPRSMHRLTVVARSATRALPARQGRYSTAQHSGEVRVDVLEEILGCLPPASFAMAYGSGVFQQKGYDATQRPMIDFILGVHDSAEWHTLNLAANKHHYAPLAVVGGGKAVAAVQRCGGQHAYYHPYVQMAGHPVKYGVMQLSDLQSDLQCWSTLFGSGRLHKPCAVLRCDAHTQALQEQNLSYALHTALLLLPRQFSKQSLWQAIASLSYCGDPRFTVGAENPNKVANIVGAAPERFEAWYAAVLASTPQLLLPESGTNEQMSHHMTVQHICAALPPVLSQALRSHGSAELGSAALRLKVQSALAKQVQSAAVVQAVKGVLSAGVVRSVQYAWEKRNKNKKK